MSYAGRNSHAVLSGAGARAGLKAGLGVLACPACKHDGLRLEPDGSWLTCAACGTGYAVEGGVPDLRYLENGDHDGGGIVHDGVDAPGQDILVSRRSSRNVVADTLKRRIRALRRVRGRLNVLDIGAAIADGGGLKPFMRTVEDDIDCYVGIDRSRCVMAGDAAPNARFNLLRGYCEHLPTRAGLFDFVLSIATFDQVFDAAKCLDEIRRVMAPDGLFYVQLVNDGSWFKQLFKKTAERRRAAAARWRTHFWTAPQFRELLGRHRFEIAEFRGHRYNPLFRHSRLASVVAGPLEEPIGRLIDAIGNFAAPDLGGNFAVLCRRAG